MLCMHENQMHQKPRFSQKNMSRWKENYSFLSLITLFFVSLKATFFLFFLPAAIADRSRKAFSVFVVVDVFVRPQNDLVAKVVLIT